MLHSPHVACCALLALAAVPAASQTTNPSAPSGITIAEITVLGRRSATSEDALPHSLESTLAADIAHGQSGDLGEALEGIPNVHTNGGPRSSAKTLQIRGISGDRILMLVDGVRQSSTKGHVGRSFVDPGMLRRVDVERGPASVQWGSGALGGVASLETKDAVDLLPPEQYAGVRLHHGYQSATHGHMSSLAGYAHLSSKVDGLIYLSHRDHDDMTLGNGAVEAYSGYKVNAGMAKLSIYPTDNQRLQLSHRSEHTSGLTPANPAEAGADASKIIDRDINTRTSRINWQAAPEGPLIDIAAQVYHTRTLVEGDTVTGTARHQKTQLVRTGLDISNTSHGSLGPMAHTFTYGIDGYRDTTRGRENGSPRGGYPDAKRDIGGVFVQDAIKWQRWTLTAGLRWDSYRSRTDNNVGQDQNENHVSSQIGLTWQPTYWLTTYVNYAEAFRAPTLEELYATGTHFGANQFIANPRLQPEQAANKEIGLRSHWQNLLAQDDQLRIEAAVFRNDVNGYIGLNVKAVPLPYPPYIGGTTQSENIQSARLTGFEISADYQLHNWFIGVGYGQTQGDDQTQHQPLSDVAPATATLRTGLANLPGDGHITLKAHFVARQDRLPTEQAPTPGYSRFDLLSSWRLTKALELSAGIINLTHKNYRQHNAIVPGPGRSARLSINWKF